MDIRMVPEKDYHITNRDGSDYHVFEKGKPIWIWDGRPFPDKIYRRFRRMVFERDGYICQMCGSENRAFLRVHHKKSVARFPNLYYDIDSVVTLCDECRRHLPRTKEEINGKV